MVLQGRESQKAETPGEDSSYHTQSNATHPNKRNVLTTFFPTSYYTNLHQITHSTTFLYLSYSHQILPSTILQNSANYPTLFSVSPPPSSLINHPRNISTFFPIFVYVCDTTHRAPLNQKAVDDYMVANVPGFTLPCIIQQFSFGQS